MLTVLDGVSLIRANVNTTLGEVSETDIQTNSNFVNKNFFRIGMMEQVSAIIDNLHFGGIM